MGRLSEYFSLGVKRLGLNFRKIVLMVGRKMGSDREFVNRDVF